MMGGDNNVNIKISVESAEAKQGLDNLGDSVDDLKNKTGDLGKKTKEAGKDTKKTGDEADETAKKLSFLGRATKSAKTGFGKLSGAAKKLNTGLKSIAVGIGAVTGSISAMAYTSINANKELQAMFNLASAGTGSLDSFNKLVFAGEAFGISIATTANGIKELNKALGENRNEGTANALKAMNMQAAEFAALDSESQLRKFGEALDSADESQRKLWLRDIGAPSLKKMLPLLNDNNKELDRMTKLYEDLQLNANEIDSAKLSELGVQFNALSAKIADVKDAVVDGLIPAFKSLNKDNISFKDVGDYFENLKEQLIYLGEKTIYTTSTLASLVDMIRSPFKVAFKITSGNMDATVDNILDQFKKDFEGVKYNFDLLTDNKQSEAVRRKTIAEITEEHRIKKELEAKEERERELAAIEAEERRQRSVNDVIQKSLKERQDLIKVATMKFELETDAETKKELKSELDKLIESEKEFISESLDAPELTQDVELVLLASKINNEKLKESFNKSINESLGDFERTEKEINLNEAMYSANMRSVEDYLSELDKAEQKLQKIYDKSETDGEPNVAVLNSLTSIKNKSEEVRASIEEMVNEGTKKGIELSYESAIKKTIKSVGELRKEISIQPSNNLLETIPETLKNLNSDLKAGVITSKDYKESILTLQNSLKILKEETELNRAEQTKFNDIYVELDEKLGNASNTVDDLSKKMSLLNLRKEAGTISTKEYELRMLKLQPEIKKLVENEGERTEVLELLVKYQGLMNKESKKAIDIAKEGLITTNNQLSLEKNMLEMKEISIEQYKRSVMDAIADARELTKSSDTQALGYAELVRLTRELALVQQEIGKPFTEGYENQLKNLKDEFVYSVDAADELIEKLNELKSKVGNDSDLADSQKDLIKSKIDEQISSIKNMGTEQKKALSDIKNQFENVVTGWGDGTIKLSQVIDDISEMKKVAASLGTDEGDNLLNDLNELQAGFLTIKELSDAIGDSFKDNVGAGIKDLISGAKSFNEVLLNILSGVLADIANQLAKMAIDGFMQSKGSGWIESAVGSLGGAFGGRAAPMPTFHKGGVVGGSKLQHDEVIAKLQLGETVLTRDETQAIRNNRSGGGGNVNINLGGDDITNALSNNAAFEDHIIKIMERNK